MIASLSPCFPGALAWYGDRIALPSEYEPAISGGDLLDGDTAERLMARFAQSHPGGDRRALVSMWTQWHFGSLIIPATLALLFMDRDLPVALWRIGLQLHEDGRTDRILLAHDGAPHDAESQRFSELFDAHVAPLIRRFAAVFGVSPRLLWTNAAAIFEWTLQQATIVGGIRPEAAEAARDLLARRTLADGARNPLFDAVRYPLWNGEPTRQRKVCCLRYLLPGVADCGSLCPLVKEIG